MATSNLARLGGLAAMGGGVIFAVQERLDPGGTLIVPINLALLSVMAVIVALHLLQRERYGYEGALASAAAFVGVALVLVGGTELPSMLPGGSMVIGTDILLMGVGMLVATIGITALGIFTLNAGVLPWWGGAALIAGNPLLGVILLFVGLDFLYGAWPVVVPWVVVGFAVFRAASHQTQQPSRVR